MSAPIVGGRMYADEGSWEPRAPLIGGPPGIPGNPRPAEPNVPGLEELGIVPTPCRSEGEETGAADALPAPPAGSSPLCRLDEDGFCGLAGDGPVCASAEETQTVRAVRRVRRTTRDIESFLSGTDSRDVSARWTNQNSWCARRELNPHAIADPGF